MRNFKKDVFILLLPVLPIFATAQTMKDSMNLKEVVVMAKTKARQIHEQAYAVSVVDLKKNYQAATPMSKIFNSITSMRVREDGGLGSNMNISMNGFSGNQVKFFIDGIPMDNFGSAFSLSTLSANMADRIEIYKGVLPVYLGSDALGGAVNIVTRSAANYLDATYSIGSFNTHRVSVNGAYTNKSGFTLRANTYLNYSDNNYKVKVPILDLQTNQRSEEQWVKRFNDGYTSYGIKTEVGITDKKWADYLLGGIIAARNNNDVQTGATMDAVYGGVKTHSWSVIPSIKYKKNNLLIPGLSLSLYATYNMVNTYNTDTLNRKYNWRGEWVEKNARGERYLTDAVIRIRQWQANANIGYVINEHHTFSLNNVFTASRRKTFDSMYPNDEMNNIPQQLTKNITGLGYQIRYRRWNANMFGKAYSLYSSTYKKKGTFTGNEQWERVENDKTFIGYGAAATYYIIPSLQAKLSAEQAYRIPEANEMFGDGLIQKSNTSLRPEKSKNFNLGLLLNHRFGNHKVMAEINGIYRNTKDFIYKAVSATNDPTTGYENTGKVETLGAEFSLGYGYKSVVNLTFNYTHQDIKDKMKYSENSSFVGGKRIENITYGQRLPNIPYRFASVHADYNINNVGWKGNRLTLNYDLSYVHDYFLSFPGLGSISTKKIIPEQISHNVSLAYTMHQGRYSVMLECNNITNALLYDNYRLQKPGRNIHMTFRYFINKF